MWKLVICVVMIGHSHHWAPGMHWQQAAVVRGARGMPLDVCNRVLVQTLARVTGLPVSGIPTWDEPETVSVIRDDVAAPRLQSTLACWPADATVTHP